MSTDTLPAPTEATAKTIAATPPKAGGQVKAFIPESVEDLKWIAGLIVQQGLAPDSYKGDVGKVVLGIMKGAEVGLAPLTSLQWIAIVNGRPAIWGDGAIALVQASGTLEKQTMTEIGEQPAGEGIDAFTDDFGFEVKMWRHGQNEPYVGRFTVGDAKRAKLWANPKRQPWMLYPKRMLRWRALGFAIRDGFADCLAGMITQNEAEDMPVKEVEHTPDTSFLDGPAPGEVIDHEPEVTDLPADEAADTDAPEPANNDEPDTPATFHVITLAGALPDPVSAEDFVVSLQRQCEGTSAADRAEIWNLNKAEAARVIGLGWPEFSDPLETLQADCMRAGAEQKAAPL